MSQGALVAVLAGSYLLGSVPGSNIVAHLVARVDLRRVGSGTVTPWNLYQRVGLWPALLAGCFEVGKGMSGPALAAGHPWWGAAAGGLAVLGHNWSPLLKGGGGRGLSTATGALLVLAWPGAAVMCAGLLAGLLLRRVIRAMGVALCALVPVLVVTGGPTAAFGAMIVAAPIGVKTAWLIHRRRADRRAAAGR